MLVRVLVAALLAGALAHRGLKKQSLDVSGAAAASFVGFCTLSCSYRFGLLLLGFYFSGSKLTKVRASVKQQLDANYKPGGQRSAGQVLACSLLATILAVSYLWHFGDDDVPIDFAAHPTRSYLLASYIGHYACCAADTWASELGVLSHSEPRLITTLRRVPPGTNGGVSVLGLAVSAFGGAFIGALYYIGSLMSGSAQLQVVTLGAVTGLFGSVLDSVLGATVQATHFDRSTRRICDESSPNADVERVCGVDLLSNEQVNVVSVLVTTAVSGPIATYFFFVNSTQRLVERNEGGEISVRLHFVGDTRERRHRCIDYHPFNAACLNSSSLMHIRFLLEFKHNRARRPSASIYAIVSVAINAPCRATLSVWKTVFYGALGSIGASNVWSSSSRRTTL